MNYHGNRHAVGPIGGGGALQNAQFMQTAASEQNQLGLINAQTNAEIKKSWAMDRRINEETHTKVQEIFRESNLNRTKMASKVHNWQVQQMSSWA